MRKKRIKLTESQLTNIINSAVRNILREDYGNTPSFGGETQNTDELDIVEVDSSLEIQEDGKTSYFSEDNVPFYFSNGNIVMADIRYRAVLARSQDYDNPYNEYNSNLSMRLSDNMIQDEEDNVHPMSEDEKKDYYQAIRSYLDDIFPEE